MTLADQIINRHAESIRVDVFERLDDENYITGMEAGKVAAAAEQAFRDAVNAACEGGE